MSKSLTIFFFAFILAGGICRVKADTIQSTATIPTELDDGLADIPAADLYGWFLTFEPSDQWTSAANIAIMESLLLTVEQIENDPALLQELYGLGLTSAQILATTQALTSDGQTPADSAVEPDTLELLGGAFVLFGLYALMRVRQAGRRHALCLAMKD